MTQLPRVLALLMLLVSAAYVWSAGAITLDFWSEGEVFNARTMPYLVGAGACFVSLLLLLAPGAQPDFSSWDLSVRAVTSNKPLAAITLVGLLLLYPVGLDYVGYPASTLLFLASAFVLMGERRVLRAVAVAAALTLAFWLIMDLLGVYLDPGPWFAVGANG